MQLNCLSGIVGSVLAKEGHIPSVSDLFSGAFKVHYFLTGWELLPFFVEFFFLPCILSIDEVLLSLRKR